MRQVLEVSVEEDARGGAKDVTIVLVKHKVENRSAFAHLDSTIVEAIFIYLICE